MVILMKTIYKSRILGGLKDFARGTVNPVTRPIRRACSAPIPKREVVVEASPRVPYGWGKLELEPAPVTPVSEPEVDWNKLPAAPSREDLVAEAKALGVKGINARWKIETIQAKIAEMKA